MIYCYLFVRLFCYCICCNYRNEILPVAYNCGNVHVRFSTIFFILENVGKIKNVKKTLKKRDTNKKRKNVFFYIYDVIVHQPCLNCMVLRFIML